MDMYYFNSFFEDLLFPLIEPLDNLYLFRGQVVKFVDELVYLGLFGWVVEIVGGTSVFKFFSAILRQPFRQLLRQPI